MCIRDSKSEGSLLKISSSLYSIFRLTETFRAINCNNLQSYFAFGKRMRLLRRTPLYLGVIRYREEKKVDIGPEEKKNCLALKVK